MYKRNILHQVYFVSWKYTLFNIIIIHIYVNNKSIYIIFSTDITTTCNYYSMAIGLAIHIGSSDSFEARVIRIAFSVPINLYIGR